MRTTVTIDDELYREVKARAARTGRSVGAVIEDALRQSLLAAQAPDRPPVRPLPTHGEGGTQPGVDLSSNAAIREVMDAGEPVDARR